jgi:hypothetical protein
MEAIIAILLHLGVIIYPDNGNQSIIRENQNGLINAEQNANEKGVNAIIEIDDLVG